MKLLFGFFSENMSFSSSILSSIAMDNGWDVDQVYFPNQVTGEEVSRRMQESRPDLIALSFRTFERTEAFKVAKIGHEQGIKVVAGGIHPSSCPADLQKSGYFDGIVQGDGVGVFADILSSHKSLDGHVIQGRRHKDINQYTRQVFTDSQRERIRASKTLEILSSFGCPFSCRFCSGSKELIEFPLENIIGQIVHCKNEYDINRVIVYDDLFTYKLSRIRKFREMLEKHNLDLGFLYTQGRCNCFSDKIASELVALGVEEMSFGVETVSERLLKFLDKRITVEDQYRTAEICRRHNLAFKITLMFGIPTQTREDYEATLQYVKDTKPAAMGLYYFVPFPGSYLFDYCMENGYMPNDFNFDTFLGLNQYDPDFKGIREQPGKINKIDYQMAAEYLKAIKDIDLKRKDEIILKIAQTADKDKWVLFGSGDYFYKVLERLSLKNWGNCLGYYDYTPDKFKALNYDVSIPYIDLKNPKIKPETVVVTSHKGRIFNTVDLPILQSEIGFTGKILSTSTYDDPNREGI